MKTIENIFTLLYYILKNYLNRLNRLELEDLVLSKVILIKGFYINIILEVFFTKKGIWFIGLDYILYYKNIKYNIILKILKYRFRLIVLKYILLFFYLDILIIVFTSIINIIIFLIIN